MNEVTIKHLSSLHEEVLQFIEDCREQDEETFDLKIEEKLYVKHEYETYNESKERQKASEWSKIYLRGNCYFFAKVLHKAFPEGEIVFATYGSHAAVTIDGLTFDARGIMLENEDDLYVPGSKLMHMFAEAWSHNYETGYAGRDLYQDVVANIVSQPLEQLINTSGWERDYLVDDIVDTLICSFDENHRVFDIAMQNGWL